MLAVVAGDNARAVADASASTSARAVVARAATTAELTTHDDALTQEVIIFGERARGRRWDETATGPGHAGQRHVTPVCMLEWLKINGTPGVVLAGVAVYPLIKPLGLVIIGAGFVLVVLGSFSQTRRLIPWLTPDRDSHFWKKAFDALPAPAFIKPYPQDEHLSDNLACRTFQGAKTATSSELPDEKLTKLYDRIRHDHRDGDKRAAARGASVQLEQTDAGEPKNPRPILTFKACIKHEGDCFIVGWFLPVKVSQLPKEGETMNVSECGGQVLFNYPALATEDEDNRVAVRIGQSVSHLRES